MPFLMVLMLLFLAVWLSPRPMILQDLNIMPLWLHIVAELFSIVVSAMVFGIGWHTYGAERPSNVTIIACGFLAIGFIDLAHTLSRIGGDEFIALFTGLEYPQDCEPMLHRLLQAASKPITIQQLQLQVSASIGVTLYPNDNVDADLLIRHADQAMYHAKQSGKNTFYIFDVAHDATVKTVQERIKRIELGLKQDEFVLYYQPKVNMKTGIVVGAEALIRWQHPDHGLLPPAAFLPVIEDQPISIEVGEWVIESALNQMRIWQNAGLNIEVSVNVSAYQLQESAFVERLTELLAAYPDVNSSLLQLEVLETAMLRDLTKVIDIMQRCRALGVNFALDDFGTGYSSLTYLKLLPADTLKIDQSFVRDMLDDPNDLAIVKGVIGLADAFGRQVIAEGVETAAHGEALLSLGCEWAQGYGIARPMPADNLQHWLNDWQSNADWLRIRGT